MNVDSAYIETRDCQYLQQFPILWSTDINDKTLVVRASCPHKVYLTQAELAVRWNYQEKDKIICTSIPDYCG